MRVLAMTSVQYERSVYLITAFRTFSGRLHIRYDSQLDGLDIQHGTNVPGSAPLVVYMQNTADATNLKARPGRRLFPVMTWSIMQQLRSRGGGSFQL